MPFEFDANGAIVLQEVDGKKQPVFIHADGKKAPFDGDGTVATIGRLNGEAKGHREAKEAAERALKAFEGITDPAAALKALTTVKNLDEKQLIAAGERDKAVQEAIKATELTYAPFKAKAEQLEQQLVGEKIGGAFARSKFIVEKVAVPADMVQAAFGGRFKLEDGKVVAYGADGNKVYSRSSPGNPADFEEALELLVDQYPHKASILKGSGASGGGAGGSGGQGGGGKTTMTRAQYQALPLAEQAAKARDKNVVITD